MISRDILGTQVCVAFGDMGVVKLIYEAASGSERGLQSRSQKKASIYDRFGALLEMLGRAPVSRSSAFSLHMFRLVRF